MKKLGTHELKPVQDVDALAKSLGFSGVPEGERYYKCTICGIILLEGVLQYYISDLNGNHEFTYRRPEGITCNDWIVMGIIK